jgi:hypothetical protein
MIEMIEISYFWRWCYKIYWEDIAMIELILLREQNEASSSNHFNGPNFWNFLKIFKLYKDSRGIWTNFNEMESLMQTQNFWKISQN